MNTYVTLEIFCVLTSVKIKLNKNLILFCNNFSAKDYTMDRGSLDIQKHQILELDGVCVMLKN